MSDQISHYDPTGLKAQLVLAEQMSKSCLLPKSLYGKPHDILILLQQGRELDIPPLQAINGINIIQGKPTISPQLMLGLIYRKAPEASIEIVCKENSVTVTMKRKGGKPYSTTWDMARAAKMQLTKKDNWVKQPMTMLKWRAVSDAARVVFPDIISGLYTPEEFDDNGTIRYDDHGAIEVVSGEEQANGTKEGRQAIESQPVSIGAESPPKPTEKQILAKEVAQLIVSFPKEAREYIKSNLKIENAKELNGYGVDLLREMKKWLEKLKEEGTDEYYPDDD